MTREQLDAIRARVEAATPGPWLTDSCLDVYTEQVREIDPDIGIELYKTVYSHHTAGPEGTQPWHDTHFMAHAREDVPALLAEVERLRDAHAMAVQVSGELCEKCGWAMRFPGEKCRCDLLAEVERLRRELDKATNDHIESQRNGAREAIARKAAEADVERLTALTKESEHQMHLRVRAGYDKTVADAWRAEVKRSNGSGSARSKRRCGN